MPGTVRMSLDHAFLTERRRAILTAIAESIRKDGFAPSLRSLAAMVGMRSAPAVGAQLKALENAGYLKMPRDLKGQVLSHTMSLTEKASLFLDSQTYTKAPKQRFPRDLD